MKLLLILTLLLAGCTSDPIIVTTEAVKKAPIVLPSVDEFTAQQFNWIIVTVDNAEQIFAKLSKKGDKLALFALSGKGYEALSTNTSDSLKLILQLKAQIQAYKKYYIVVPKDTKQPAK